MACEERREREKIVCKKNECYVIFILLHLFPKTD